MLSLNVPEKPGAESYAKNLQEIFEKLFQSSPESKECVYKIAGKIIKLRFIRNSMGERLTPAFSHLATAEKSPDFTVCIFDNASSGTQISLPEWCISDSSYPGEYWRYEDESLKFNIEREKEIQRLILINKKTNSAFYLANDAKKIPWWESGAPLKTLLHWWLQQQGIQLIHGAAIGIPEGGVIIAGKGGSGKSTTALSCLFSPLSYAADDYVLVSSKPEPFVHSIYCTGKLNQDNIERIPELADKLIKFQEGDLKKTIVFLHEFYPEKMISGFPLKAILIPKITKSEKSSIKKTSPAEALKALAPSTIFQLREENAAIFKNISELIKIIPSYELNLGSNRQNVVESIKKFLEENKNDKKIVVY